MKPPHISPINLSNSIISDYIDYNNRVKKRAVIEKKLKQESKLVKTDSMAVLKDFEDLMIVIDLE